MFKRNSRRFGGALALVVALMAGNAAAESLTGAWRCTFTRTDKSTYRVVIKLTPTTGQWSDQPAAPLKVSGNEASFMTRLSTGTDGNMVSMTLAGNTVQARLSGRAATSSTTVRGQTYSNTAEFLNMGTCTR